MYKFENERYDKLPKGKEDVSDQPSVFRYFDLTRNEWRSFRLDNFIGFVEEVKRESNQREQRENEIS